MVSTLPLVGGLQQKTGHGQEAGAEPGAGEVEVLHPEPAPEQAGALLGPGRDRRIGGEGSGGGVRDADLERVRTHQQMAADAEAVRRSPDDTGGRSVDDDLRDLADRRHDRRPEGAAAKAYLLGAAGRCWDGGTEVELGRRGHLVEDERRRVNGRPGIRMQLLVVLPAVWQRYGSGRGVGGQAHGPGPAERNGDRSIHGPPARQRVVLVVRHEHGSLVGLERERNGAHPRASRDHVPGERAPPLGQRSPVAEPDLHAFGLGPRVHEQVHVHSVHAAVDRADRAGARRHGHVRRQGCEQRLREVHVDDLMLHQPVEGDAAVVVADRGEQRQVDGQPATGVPPRDSSDRGVVRVQQEPAGVFPEGGVGDAGWVVAPPVVASPAGPGGCKRSYSPAL